MDSRSRSSSQNGTPQGNEIRKNFSMRVTGVLKETRGESDWTIYFPLDQIKALNEWAQGPPHQLQQGRL